MGFRGVCLHTCGTSADDSGRELPNQAVVLVQREVEERRWRL